MATRVIDRTETQLLQPAAPEDNGALPHLPIHIPEIGEILMAAVEKGMTAESLEKLVALHERTSDRAAAREAARALAAFQKDCPTIPKTSTAQIATKSGAKFSYPYAELDQIAKSIRPILHQHGLSYGWDSSEADGRLTCVCRVRHENGHSFTATFSCSTATDAGMSAMQKSASALTYAKRQALVQALGLVTGEPDLDGAVGGGPKIAESQIADITMTAKEVGANYDRFLKYFGISQIEDLPAAKFQEAMDLLKRKGRGA